MLNGTTRLHIELEERIAKLLGKDTAMLLSSGCLANGWPAALVRPGDLFVWDERLHASLQQGGMQSLAGKRGLEDRNERVSTHAFQHNNVKQLEGILRRFRQSTGDLGADFVNNPPRQSVWVAIEGVYSMDGDLAPLVEISNLAKRYGAFVVVDDAHGEGVLGQGKGIEHHFNEPTPTFLTVGTLGKAWASGGGGFIAGGWAEIEYLRVHLWGYVYSTSLSIANTAAALKAIDIIEREPWRVTSLRDNVQYLANGLRKLGIEVEDRDSGIIGISAPARTDLRKLAQEIHDRGIFLSTVEAPVVPVQDQHIRINVMSTHSRAQLDRLLAVMGEFHQDLVWSESDKEAAKKPK